MVGEQDGFAGALTAMGCECTPNARGGMRLLLAEGVEVRDVYKLASDRNLQLRRLSQRRDTLEDIFLKAMEANTNGGV